MVHPDSYRFSAHLPEHLALAEGAQRRRATSLASRMARAIAGFFESSYRRWKAARQRRADYLLLQSLSDAQLKDIGIGRSEIRFRVAHPDADDR